MASESAVLGTPAIYVSTIRLGYTRELEEKYGLVCNFDGADRQTDAVKKGVAILEDYDQQQWDQRRARMLDDKTDTTEFILDQIIGTSNNPAGLTDRQRSSSPSSTEMR